MTLVYSSVVFHIYPYLRGNSIPSDRNYRSAVVTIWSAVKRGRLNLDLVLVWRHTTYDYMTYNCKSSRTCGKMAHEGQHQSPLELITQNVRSILADVLNKLECGDVDHSIDFARYRVEWLCSVLLRLGGSLEENLLPRLQEAQQLMYLHSAELNVVAVTENVNTFLLV